MNKPILFLTALAMGLTCSVLAQDQAPGTPPERERPPLRERFERPESRERRDSDRSGDRGSERSKERTDRSHFANREPIPVDQLDQAIATLRAMHPDAKLDWLDHIEELAKEDPEEAARRLARYPRLRELMDARANRPAEFELNATQSRLMREVFPMVRQIRQAQTEQGDQAKLDELRGQLRERFEALFEVRLKLKELEIERIRKQLQQAEQELVEINGDRDKLIREKMEELLKHGDPRGPRDEGGRPERPQREDRSRNERE